MWGFIPSIRRCEVGRLAISEAFNMDCMEGLKQFPDKYFDLAVVDPPYGGGCSQNVHVERERERERTPRRRSQ